MANQITHEDLTRKLGVDEALETLNKEVKGRKDEINRLINEKYSNLKDMMEETKRTTKEAMAEGKEKAKEMASGIDTRVRTNPWMAISIAVAGGFLIGYVVESMRTSH
ncbi:MAG: DUF883 family protein [wastewater metagenome]|nr:DUF883 family protein [Candidatus Loosdrechtia aerotolerans]